MTLAKVKEAIQKFEDLQEELSNFGASDTEPDGEFQSHLAGALRGKVPGRVSAAQWELFSSEKGVGAAARRLSAASNAACKTIKQAIAKQNNPDDIIDHVKDYCWRIIF